jgi:2-furoyl-CoA dehydrogenase large subunit
LCCASRWISGSAIDRVRFVGEAVALVVAADRYVAEDALDDITVEYRKLPAVVDPLAAMEKDAAGASRGRIGTCRPTGISTGGNPGREICRGRPRGVAYHRLPALQTPLEGYVVVADYQPGEGVYDVLCNFQGPFTVHPVMSKALRCQARSRNPTPAYSGGGSGSTGHLSCCRTDVYRIKRTGRPSQMGGGSFRDSPLRSPLPTR